jgi:hypothetical protein
MATMKQGSTHLGPIQLPDGSFRVIFENPCQRPKAEHSSSVICETMSGTALGRLKQSLEVSGALGDPPRTWTNRNETFQFLTGRVLLAKGHTVCGGTSL